RDYGQLATIGRNAAVAEFGRVKLSGYPAWLLWLVAHIYFLIIFRNRVVVGQDLSVPGRPEVFVIGDLASIPGVPGIAPAAKQMGRHTAMNIRKSLSGQARVPFRYRDYGQLATIGRNAAVAEFGRVKLSGYPAWLLWLVAHIYFLINFRNRVVVLFDWAWAYWTFARYARIVIRNE
ncbi:MAG TPA: hypothetical protein VD965_12875, partial [Burkholderiales bacterium]|nr:hypothetical protein [Burkholderiales bacterium]